jgi:hypothetical protein
MKTSVILASLLAASAHGFSVARYSSSSTSSSTTESTRLHAKNSQPEEPVNGQHLMTRRTQITQTAAALLGLVASPMMANAETSLDFSLPSYDAKMQGFGDGKEAILNTKGSADRTDPGANEKEKEQETMRKAEQGRLEAKARKKAEMQALEDESKRRAAEKKARDAERLKNIWAN